MSERNGWYSDNHTLSTQLNGAVTITGEYAEIKFDGNGYRVSEISYDIFDINNHTELRISLEIENSGLACDLLVSWKNKDTVIAEEYINDFPWLTPPENSDSLVLTVLAYSDKKGYIKLNPPVKEEREIKKHKKFKAAALSPYYHFWSDNYNRGFDDNLKEALEKIDAVYKEETPDLIVLTENFYSRWAFKEPLEKGVVSVNSEPIKKMRKKAMELSVFISFSFAEIDENNTRYNAALLIDRKGEIIAHYRKTHLTIGEKKSGLKHGDGPLVVDTEFGKIGFAICWDLFFPEYVKKLADMGAEIIINPSAGYHENMNTVRAMDNGVYIITAGPLGTGTAIIDPLGNQYGNPIQTGTAIAEIDLGKRFYRRGLSAASSAEWANICKYEERNDIYNK